MVFFSKDRVDEIILFPFLSYAAGSKFFKKLSLAPLTFNVTFTVAILSITDSPPDTSITFGFALHEPTVYPSAGVPSVSTVTLTCFVSISSRDTFNTCVHSSSTSEEVAIFKDGLISTELTAESSDRSAVALISEASRLSTTLLLPRTRTVAVPPSTIS